MHGKIPSKKHKTQNEFSWNLEVWVERPYHLFVSWWWMDGQIFGSPIFSKAKLSQCFVPLQGWIQSCAWMSTNHMAQSLVARFDTMLFTSWMSNLGCKPWFANNGVYCVEK